MSEVYHETGECIYCEIILVSQEEKKLIFVLFFVFCFFQPFFLQLITEKEYGYK
jgi:galactose-1-phosphate uridylyltransferase